MDFNKLTIKAQEAVAAAPFIGAGRRLPTLRTIPALHRPTVIRARAPATRRESLRAKPAMPTRPRWPAPKNRTDTVRLAVSVRKISLLRTRLWSFGASHIACAAEQPQPKRFRRGTHRVADPRETLARVRPYMARMGITRLGNITGLDRIGIPVAIAVRPNSRSVSVSQGKGLDLAQAMASALMEACNPE